MLNKKRELLSQIMIITENQENILLSPHAASDEGAAFFTGLNEEKQNLIELVLEADKLFQHSFDELKDEFELKARDNAEDVQALKDSIKEIVDLDSKIRVKEEKNRMLLDKVRYKNKIDMRTANKAHVLKQYKKNKYF